MSMKKKINPKVILFNGAAGVIMLSAAFVHIKSIIFPPGITVCSERYNRTIRFSLERNGTLLSASDIQSTAVGRDYGLLENFSVERVSGAPTSAVFGIDIKPGSQQAQNEAGVPGGISFPWKPRALPTGATSTCLAYSVLLPEDFEFENGGTLPGIYGMKGGEPTDKPDRFDVRAEWITQGQAIQFMMFATEKNTGYYRSNGELRFVIPRGRWVRLEQEVILNEPGTANAVVRFWMDGVLVSENKDADLRSSADVTIEGVSADVHFGITRTENEFPHGRAKKAEKVLITPFEMKFQ